MWSNVTTYVKCLDSTSVSKENGILLPNMAMPTMVAQSISNLVFHSLRVSSKAMWIKESIDLYDISFKD